MSDLPPVANIGEGNELFERNSDLGLPQAEGNDAVSSLGGGGPPSDVGAAVSSLGGGLIDDVANSLGGFDIESNRDGVNHPKVKKERSWCCTKWQNLLNFIFCFAKVGEVKPWSCFQGRAQLTEKNIVLHNQQYDEENKDLNSDFGVGFGSLGGDDEDEYDADQVFVREQLLYSLKILVGYLQQLSLLILDEVDFGNWGNVFENIKFLSINIDFQFNLLQGEVAYLTAVFLLPVAVMLWYTIIEFTSTSHINGLYLSWLKPLLFLSLLLFLVLTIAFTILDDISTGLVFLVPFGYILALIIFQKIRAKFISPEDEDYQQKIRDEFVLNDIAFALTFPVVVSAFVRVAILNENQDFALIGGITGGILIVIMLIRIFLRNSRRQGPIIDGFRFVLLNFCVVEVVANGRFTSFRPGLDLFEIVLFIEKGLLASVPVILLDKVVDADDFVGFIVLGIILTSLLLVVLARPNRSTLDLYADTFSRTSNIIIFALALLNTFLRDEKIVEQVETEDDAEAEPYISIVMLLVSLYMFLFWIHLLEKLDVGKVLKSLWKSFLSLVSLVLFYVYHKPAIYFRWKNVKNHVDAGKVVLKRKDQMMTKLEMKLLSDDKKIAACCVQKSKTFDEAQINRFQEEFNGTLLLPPLKESFVDLNRFGFFNLRGVRKIDITGYRIRRDLFDFLLMRDSGYIEDVLCKTVEEIDLRRRLDDSEMMIFMDELVLFQNLRKINLLAITREKSNGSNEMDIENQLFEIFVDNIENVEGVESLQINSYFTRDKFQNFIEKLTACNKIKELNIGINSKLTDDMMKDLFASLREQHTLETIRLDYTNCKTVELMIRETAAVISEVEKLNNFEILFGYDTERFNVYCDLLLEHPNLNLSISAGKIVQEDRGEQCNVYYIDMDDNQAITKELMWDYGFAYDFNKLLEFGVCNLTVTVFSLMNDHWKEIFLSKMDSELYFPDRQERGTMVDGIIKYGFPGSAIIRSLNFFLEKELIQLTNEQVESVVNHRLPEVKEWAQQFQ